MAPKRLYRMGLGGASIRRLCATRVCTPVLAAVVPALTAACGGSSGESLSAVLITLDTTNLNALDCYRRTSGITPNLDALADQSLVYDNARSVAPLTLPAHASMLTGLYPIRHTVRDNGLNPLPPAAETLAERARARGYQTGAFIASQVMASPYGLEQGFDVYWEPTDPKARPRASEMTGAAVDWLERRDRSRPFFLWVHYFDPHAPYEPSPRFREQVARVAAARFPDYLAEVAQMDAAIGDLIDVLERERTLDHILLAVVADHGESHYRHQEATHSMLVYDVTIRVPMLIRYPDGYRAAERSDGMVSVADVFPTFLEALGLGEPGDVDGRSLYRRAVPADRGVYFESFSGFLNLRWSPLSGWADARGTYIHSSEPEFFAPGDARQQDNLIDDEQALAGEHRERIARLAERPALPPGGGVLDEDFRARIQALGYLGGAEPEESIPHPLNTAALPTPRRHMEELGALLDAALLESAGKRGEAIELLEAHLRELPDDRFTMELLGRLLNKEERYEEAVVVLRPIMQMHPPRRRGMWVLAAALKRTGRHAEALEVYLAGHEVWPEDQELLRSIIEALGLLGHAEEAERFRRKLRP